MNEALITDIENVLKYAPFEHTNGEPVITIKPALLERALTALKKHRQEIASLRELEKRHAEALTKLGYFKHQWEVEGKPGMYEDIYKCVHCEARCVDSPDRETPEIWEADCPAKGDHRFVCPEIMEKQK